jgi:arylsulfatase A-like enzyme
MSADRAPAAPVPARLADVWVQGPLIGAGVGVVAALVEHVRLAVGGSLATDSLGSYWEIAIPHLLLGVGGGLALAGLVVAVRRRRLRLASEVGVLVTLAAVLAGWLYTSVATAYWIGPPVARLSTLAAVAGWAVAMAIIALPLRHVVTRILTAVERRSIIAVRLAVPVTLLVLIALPLALESTGLLLPTRAKAVEASAPGGPSANRPNILLVVIDAMRADHLPVYGYSRQTAPRIGALAAAGATLTQMYAQSASTRPSIATLFSSLYPAVHKVHYERDFLSHSVTSLAEVLRSHGYRTFGVSSNANVSPTFGYAQGFDEFRVWKTESRFRLTMAGRAAEDVLGPHRLGRLLGERGELVPRADAITNLTLEWAAQAATSPAPPVFMYVHYIDPHYPYRPPAPFDRMFDHRDDRPRRAGDIDARTTVSGRDPEAVAAVLDQYDGEILFADRELARLLDGLQSRGMLRDTVVMVTSDHGEEFFDHGTDSHGRSAYEEVLRVPLVVAWPGRITAGVRHDRVTGLIDVMPTLLDLAGIPVPDGLQGSSFAACLTATCGPDAADRPLFAQVVQDTFALEMVRHGRYKLVRHVRGPRTGERELYDLVDDPLERRSVTSTRAQAAADLERRLDAFNHAASVLGRRIAPERARTIDAATRRALESLGYLK